MLVGMKTDLSKLTVDTYDRSASQFADHFQNYVDGVARQEIEKSLELAGNSSKARVVEIGCGAGKDAAELVRRVAWYEGFDPSEELLKTARAHVPTASFVQTDAVSYEYPDNLDIVFAFASLLHVDKDDFAAVCSKVAKALRPGGIFCMTLKEADEYKEELQEDQFGQRQFFFYNPQIVLELAGPQFELVFEDHELAGPKKKRWFTVILKRIEG
jgi:SAM-dependent methyltransferase